MENLLWMRCIVLHVQVLAPTPLPTNLIPVWDLCTAVKGDHSATFSSSILVTVFYGQLNRSDVRLQPLYFSDIKGTVLKISVLKITSTILFSFFQLINWVSYHVFCCVHPRVGNFFDLCNRSPCSSLLLFSHTILLNVEKHCPKQLSFIVASL